MEKNLNNVNEHQWTAFHPFPIAKSSFEDIKERLTALGLEAKYCSSVNGKEYILLGTIGLCVADQHLCE